MTDGIASTNEAERSSVPPASSWTISAFSPSTRHTARRRPTVVRGSYVTLSSSTRRTPASRLVRHAKDSLTGAAGRPQQPRNRGLLAPDQRFAVLADGPDLAVPPSDTLTQRPGGSHHDLGTVLARHAKDRFLAQAQRFLRLVLLQPASGKA